MPLKTVHYQRLETEESEDEAPPVHVQLNGANHVKGKPLLSGEKAKIRETLD